MDIEKWTIEKALQIGAEMELESYNLYTKTAKTAKYPGSKKLLTEIAEDEKRHREYFLKGLEDPSNIKARTLQENIPDLKITDRLVKVPLDPNADYPQVLIFAAQREKVSGLSPHASPLPMWQSLPTDCRLSPTIIRGMEIE